VAGTDSIRAHEDVKSPQFPRTFVHHLVGKRTIFFAFAHLLR